MAQQQPRMDQVESSIWEFFGNNVVLPNLQVASLDISQVTDVDVGRGDHAVGYLGGHPAGHRSGTRAQLKALPVGLDGHPAQRVEGPLVVGQFKAGKALPLGLGGHKKTLSVLSHTCPQKMDGRWHALGPLTRSRGFDNANVKSLRNATILAVSRVHAAYRYSVGRCRPIRPIGDPTPSGTARSDWTAGSCAARS